MSYNYLGLVNDVLGRFNETPLTAANLVSSVGAYAVVKEGVNSAIRTINQQEFNWPFNYVEEEQTLSAGSMRYSFPTNAKSVDFNVFRIKRNTTFGNVTTTLDQMDYEEYLSKYIDDEYNSTDTGIRGVPRRIIRTPSQEFIVYPSPDKAYELVYEYYALPVDLILDTDVPSLPTAFRHIIAEGASIYMYNFQSDIESQDRASAKFTKQIQDMRKVYINRYEDLRDTRIGSKHTATGNS
jgi:hypothetical protein|tara:strand:+ start:1024 stop:1740 length:717 start_codon:yes stop_codon:yes gene_type:complete